MRIQVCTLLTFLGLISFGCKEDPIVPELFELRACESLGNSKVCDGHETTLSFGLTRFYVSVRANTELQSTVTFNLFYEGEFFGENVLLLNDDEETTFRVNSLIEADVEFPRGDYAVEAILSGGNTIANSFSIR